MGKIGSPFATTDSSVLDFLRACGVSLVLVSHLLEASRSHSLWSLAQQLGWMGVMLFFVHTSLVLMFSLDRTPARGASLVMQFYLKRGFRIYPLSIIVILTILIFHIPVASWPWQPADTSLFTVCANFLLVQNLVYAPSVLGPLWSLPLELQMYVLLPFLYWIVARGTRFDLAVALWFVFLAMAFVQPHITDRASVLQYGPCFMSGVIAFCVSKRRQASWPFWTWILALSCVSLVFVSLTIGQGGSKHMPLTWCLTMTIGWLIPHFHEASSRVVRDGCATIAKYSYGIYLTHMIAFWLVFVKLSVPTIAARVVLSLGLTAVFSTIAYHFVEAPGILLGSRLASRLIKPTPLLGSGSSKQAALTLS